MRFRLSLHSPLVFSVILATPALGQFCLGPSTAISTADLQWMASDPNSIVDAPLVTFTSGSKRYYLVHGDGIQKATGSLSRPIEHRVWPGGKGSDRLYPAGVPPVQVTGLDYDTHVWIMSVYQDQASGGLLAFLHIEAVAPPVPNSSTVEGLMNRWVGRIGLAWSTNQGESFAFLGYIVQPYSSTGEPRLANKSYPTGTGIDIANVQGVPYFIAPVNGESYFHIYYQERDYGYRVGVARAKVSEVISAATSGGVTSWSKYHNGGWTSAGMGGPSTPTNGLSGVTHSGAGYNASRGKAYMTLTYHKNLEFPGAPSSIRLFESTDFVNWTLTTTIATDPVSSGNVGFQYAWISPVETAQNPNPATTGQIADRFYVYSLWEYSNRNTFHGKRWTIDVSQSPQACSGASIPSTPNLPAGNFSRDDAVFYSNGPSYCRYALQSQITGEVTPQPAIPNGMANQGVCAPSPAMTSGYFKIANELFYTDLTSACRASDQNGGSGTTYLALSTYIPFVGWSCNVPLNGAFGGTFIHKGGAYWSNGSAYCKLWDPVSTSGAPNLDPKPNQQNHGTCQGNPAAGWFTVRGVLYYTNGAQHYCTANNQNPAGRNPKLFWEIPSGMIHAGVCTGG